MGMYICILCCVYVCMFVFCVNRVCDVLYVYKYICDDVDDACFQIKFIVSFLMKICGSLTCEYDKYL